MTIGAAFAGLIALVWRILDALRKVLHLLLLLVIFGFVLALMHTTVPKVPGSAALLLAPEGELVEQLSTDAVRRAIGEASGGPAPETLLKDVIDVIATAKTDKRIKLIVLDVGSMSGTGLSKLQEVGAALRDFRAAGKRVVAVGDSFDQGQYYLAAQAGEVYLDPLGLIYIDGFSYYRMFLKDAVDKLGIDVNVFKVGTYKSFTDQFSRSEMSPTEREETTAWLNVLWNAYQQDVSRARSLPLGALSDYVAQAPAALEAVNGDAARLALQRGLVTALKSRRQVADEIKAIVGEDESNHSYNGITMSQYLAAIHTSHLLRPKSDAHIGIVVASGEIVDGRRPSGSIGGDSTSDLLRDARYDDSVKAIVLRVDSPGGSMFASEQILREVVALRKAGKPVVVSMSTYAASGGYYISAAANQIFASPTTLTGSIGVFSVIPTFQRTLAKIGVTVDGVGTTAMAGDLRLDRPIGADSRRLLQASVEHAYSQFLKRVAEGRKKSVEEVDRIAQGRVWAGTDAQRIGLVDNLGSLKDAIEAAAKLADLPNDTEADYIEPEQSLREQVLDQLRGEGLHLAALSGLMHGDLAMAQAIDPILAQAREIARLSDPRGLYAYCWCREPRVSFKERTSPR